MRMIKELAEFPSNSKEYKRRYQLLKRYGSIEEREKRSFKLSSDDLKLTFEQKRGEGSFNKLVELLSLSCNTYESIGKSFGVSRERVRQWRVQWADEYGWNESGFKRRNHCTIQRGIQRAIDKPNISHQFFIDKLKSEGLEWKVSITQGQIFTKRSNVLFVNGYRCKLSLRKTVVMIDVNLYYNFYTSKSPLNLDKFDYQLFGCGDDVYIVPAKLICFHYQGGHINIPKSFDNYGYNNHFPRIDWRHYKNAWWLLSKRKGQDNMRP